MSLWLRIYSGDVLKETEITDRKTVSAGAGEGDDIQIGSMGTENVLQLKLTKKGWQYRSRKAMAGEAKTGEVKTGDFHVAEDRSFSFVIYSAAGEPKRFPLEGESEILIGRRSDCRIRIDSLLVSRHHAVLQKKGACWELTDCSSSGETYVNGRKIAHERLSEHDVIDLGLCRAVFEGSCLSLSFDGRLELTLRETEEIFPYDGKKGYPLCFSRSPRLLERIETEEIELPAAPRRENAPAMNWASAILRPLITVGMMLGMVFLFSYSPMTLMFSAPMTVVSLIFTVTDYRSRRKGYKKGLGEREKRYRRYLEQLGKTAREKQMRQRAILLEDNPEPPSCIGIAKRRDRRLWNRRPEDEDFVRLRVGLGEIPSCFLIRAPKEQPFSDRDDLDIMGEQMAASLLRTKDCPVLLDLLHRGTCGIIGERKDVIPLVRSMAAQAAVNHSYEELKLILICRKDEWAEWAPIRWLPHIFDDTRSSRYIVDSFAAAEQILPGLTDELKLRFREEEGTAPGAKERGPQLPYLLFLCADRELMQGREIMDYLVRNDPQAGVGALFLFDRMNLLPNQCAEIVDIDGSAGMIYSRENAGDQQRFTADHMSVEEFDQLARELAPLRLEEGVSQELPVSVTFLQGYGVNRAEELDLGARWSNARPEVSMAVPIGVMRGGKPFYFDIHEKKHGTQGVVAGMTGSGKTETVQSWILSMAVHFPPEAVSFVLIDFKGTGLILPFVNLPHLAGTISDMDTNINRNLVALENELGRRERLLNENGVKNINEYLSLYRQRRVEEPLAVLMIIIDEFAEFKVRYPDYMEKINSIFARGRALGVFIMLLTQKPAGVVGDKMSGNSRFFWCLKVASAGDSRDVLGKPDAARITNPGRAYIRVGEDEVYEQIQAYYSGSPYMPGTDQKKAGKLYVVDAQGRKERYEAEATAGYRSGKSEIDAVVEYIDDYVRGHGLGRARSVWTKKLDSVICLNQLLTIAFDGEKWNREDEKCVAVIGMADDPVSQSQYPLRLNFSDQGGAAVYGAPGSGKTVLLQTAVFSLALSYSPDAVQMYLLDFGGGALSMFQDLPHVGEAVLRDEQERLEKTVKLLGEELERRKKLFAASGAMNVPAYRMMTGQKLPCWIVVLDNAAQAFGTYPDLQDFIRQYSQEGGTYGMYLLISAGSQSGLSYKIAENLRVSLVLHMNDASDYSSILGRTGGLVPEDLPGRGLVKDGQTMEFQTALPVEGATDNDRFLALRALIRLMKEKWTGELPPGARLMPEHVRVGDVSGPGIGLGLSYEDLARASVEPPGEAFLVISAEESAGRGLWRAVLKQCMAMPAEQILVYDADGSMTDGLPDAGGTAFGILRTGEEFDRCLGEMLPLIQQRRELQKAGAGQVFAPIVFLLPEWKTWYEAVSDKTGERMVTLISLGAALGVMVVMMGTPDWVARLYKGKEPMLTGMLRNGVYLIAGGKPGDHCLLDLRMPYREQQTAMGREEGYVFRNGRYVKIRLAEEPEGV